MQLVCLPIKIHHVKNQIATTAFALVCLIFFGQGAIAQIDNDMSIGFNVGTYIYKGDLSPAQLGSTKTMRPGFSVFAIKPINRILDARLQISIAKLAGDDSRYAKPGYMQSRNFSFTTGVKEFSAQLVWNMLGSNNDEPGIKPFLFSGAGIAFINVQKDYSRIDRSVYGPSSSIYANLNKDDAVGSPRNIVTIPVGLGANLPVSERVSFHGEFAYRILFTDYFDGFSEAASTQYKDSYYSTSIGIVYRLRGGVNSVACPRN